MGERHLYGGEGEGTEGEVVEPDPEGAGELNEHVFQAQVESRGTVSLRTIGLWVGNARTGREEYVNALLDDGSTGSILVSEELAESLGLTGHLARTTVEGVGGQLSTNNTLVTQVRLRSSDGQLVRQIPAQVMARPAGSYRPVDWNVAKENYPHLRDLAFPPLSARWEGVHVLLGSRNPHLLRALEERAAGEKLPAARRTPLGWTAVGVVGGRQPDSGKWQAASILPQAQEKGYYCWGDIPEEGHQCHFRHSQQQDNLLHRLVEKMWTVEDLGDAEALSPAEEYVLELMRTKGKRRNGRYELPCTWKPANTRPGEHYAQALQRLQSLERSAVFKIPGVKKKYQGVIDEWEEEEVTKRVSKGPETAHFIAHFPVYNPHKISSKVRPVMDCSVALNDHLLAGPKLINEVVDVLLRFRSGLVAYSGDVAKMFLRIYLRPEDRPYHCFLWRAAPQEELVIYQFQSHVFGNKGSPFVALFALREQAKAWRSREPQAAATLAHSTLVDDVLDSADSVTEARDTLEAVRVILGDMGMEVKKCMASNSQVLQHLPAGARAEELLDVAALCQDPQGKTELKALGVQYCPRSDMFTFQMQVEEEGGPWTKRKILRVFPRLFDPLGFLLPYVMTARCVFSAVARAVKGWDEKLSQARLPRWLKWMQQLKELDCVQVPRCVKTTATNGAACLHVFCDASGEAYAAVAYLVTPNAGGKPTARMVMSRGRVAPAQTRSIPRLELLGAHLGIQLGRAVEKALKIELAATHYWTDSLS